MKQPSWWGAGVVYQIYPRSFCDASGDGIGDLRGIARKLDYLEWLGVDAVWISPFYPSPMKDFGYDISDYCGVDPVFGTLSDFDRLVEEAHGREIKVILDYVPNHTSDEHPWFVEARSSRKNPKRDWYIWRDPKPGGKPEESPPNNWESIHGGGSAWEFDEATEQFYLHTFQVEQPDLNWSNPEVREALYGVMRFWFERGVDGFRIDALPHMAKDRQFRDDLPNPDWHPEDPPSQRLRRLYSEDQPEVMEMVRGMRAVANEYEGRVLIGEIYRPLARLMDYYGEDLDGIHLPYNFGLVLLKDWTPAAVGAFVEEYERALPEGAAANWVLGNHDNPRVASRVGEAQSRVAQMLLLTLRGSPTCYYGDEIAMTDGHIPPGSEQDPQSRSNPNYNRDPERTPMQWDASSNAGFCPETAEPWLPLPEPEVLATHNVAAQQKDPRSTLSMFRRLLGLRRKVPALTGGSFRRVETKNPSVLAYARELGGEERLLVALNFGPGRETLDLSAEALETGAGEVLLSTLMDRRGSVHLRALTLRPHEGVVLSSALRAAGR